MSNRLLKFELKNGPAKQAVTYQVHLEILYVPHSSVLVRTKPGWYV